MTAESITSSRQGCVINLYLPVLMKDIRTKMHGKRVPVLLFTITGLNILLGLIIISMYWSALSSGNLSVMPHIGESLFAGVITLECLFCAIITPAVSAGTITGEREQETLEPLLLTRLSTVNIVLGKLISSQSIVIVLMLCSLPFQVAAVMLGGVSPRCCSGR